MTINHDERSSVADDNIGRLLSSSPSLETMPADTRQRILGHLIEAAEARQRPWWHVQRLRRPLGRLTPSWRPVAVGAVAVLIVGMVVLAWPWSVARAVGWRDVVAQLSESHAVILHATVETTSQDGQAACIGMKTSARDGGWLRQETYRLPGGCLEDPDGPSFAGAELLTTLISTGAPGERRTPVLLSHPTRTAQIGTAAALEDAEAVDVTALWTRLAGVAESATRLVGERQFGRARLVGFEAPLDALVGRAAARDRGSLVRVWADPGTAVPARIDVEWRMAERTIRTTIFRLAWRVELPDSLFEVTIPDGWTVVRLDR